MAPYLPAMVLVIQKDKQNPSQLKMNATKNNRNMLFKVVTSILINRNIVIAIPHC